MDYRIFFPCMGLLSEDDKLLKLALCSSSTWLASSTYGDQPEILRWQKKLMVTNGDEPDDIEHNNAER